MKISNPYNNIVSMVRHRAITHEHSFLDIEPLNQVLFERCLNRGIDVFCGVSYQPSVPSVPVTGWSYDYEDWELVLDGNGNIVYETDSGGNIKTKTMWGHDYPIPQMTRVTRNFSDAFHDFEMADGNMSDIANLVQLPNSEHAFFTYPNGEMRAGTHINFIGSVWGDAVNGKGVDVDKYNNENGTQLNVGAFRQLFPLWTLAQVCENVRGNLMFQNKVFGTINHPGYSSLRDDEVDLMMNLGGDLFKSMEVYNHTDSQSQAEYDISFYDRTLMRGYKLWCVAVNDWGSNDKEITNIGCNLLYLPASYESATLQEKAEMALDAYISGCFCGAGYGKDIDINNVTVDGNIVSIEFNTSADSIITDIDGDRTVTHNRNKAIVKLDQSNTFVRFEAYKDDDFLFTQPFYVLDRKDGLSIIQKAAVLFDGDM